MSSDLTFVTAVMVGFFGGVHCVGMCGGIVSALSLSVSDEAHARPRRWWAISLAYNIGRISSYSLAGVLVGGFGAMLTQLAFLNHAQQVLQVLAAMFMLVLGLYLGGWWNGLVRVEKAGFKLWQRLEPFGRRFVPVTSLVQAYLLGLVWGWLPCGLVYSVLIWAMAAGSALEGGLLMLSFGLGTLPNLLIMGVLAAQVRNFVRRPWPRRLAGGLVLCFAGIMIWRVV